MFILRDKKMGHRDIYSTDVKYQGQRMKDFFR